MKISLPTLKHKPASIKVKFHFWKIPFLTTLFIVLCSTMVLAQNKTITGIVTDAETGEPIIGASVRLVDSKLGTAADEKGNFKLQVPSANATLQITSVGYKTIEIKVQDGVNHIKLSAINKQLNDVVVVGYGTKKRSDITGAVVSVPKARLAELPVTNVMQSLEGAVAGLNITTTSSVPGSSPSIVSRGNNSINAGSSPYIVIDGIPVIQTAGGNYNNINPNDIASIEVLKDASATAIYGVKGSSGVILITTKRGTTGKPVIRYNAYGGVENLAHILKPRSGADYIQKYADYMKQTGQTQTSPVPNYGELDNYNAGREVNWLDVATQQGNYYRP